MILGLGTGSTVQFFLEALSQKIKKENLIIKAVSSSEQTNQSCQKLDIPISKISDISQTDLTIDGADEVDPSGHLIKGGGGALFREKIIANIAKKLIIMVDNSKKVEILGKFPLPVEVSPYGWKITENFLQKTTLNELGSQNTPSLKIRGGEKNPFITDNNNYIIDIHCQRIPNPIALENAFKNITGVLEIGLFTNMKPLLIIGDELNHKIIDFSL